MKRPDPIPLKRTDPTPLEIRLRCREIQSKWEPKDEWRHAGKPQRTWTAPTVQVTDLAAAASEVLADEQP